MKLFDFKKKVRISQNEKVAFWVSSMIISSCQLKPIVIHSDIEKATLINSMYKKTFYEMVGGEFKANDLLREFVNIIADEKGIQTPRLHLKLSNNDVKGSSLSTNEITLFGNKYNYNTTDVFGVMIPQLLSTLAHETQHILQYACVKEFLKGEKVRSKFVVMCLASIFYLIRNPKIVNYTSKTDLACYFYFPNEIDARIASCEFLLEQLKNPYILNNVKSEICKHLINQTIPTLHVSNVKKYYKGILEYNYKIFKKEYKKTDLGKQFISLYKSAQSIIDQYGNNLDEFEKTYIERIYNAICEFEQSQNPYKTNTQSEVLKKYKEQTREL